MNSVIDGALVASPSSNEALVLLKDLIGPTLKKWFGIEIEGRTMVPDVHVTGYPKSNTVSAWVRVLDTGMSYPVCFDGFDLEGEVSILAFGEETFDCPFV